MESIELCDYYSAFIEIHVTAYLEEGKLRIEGQDLGENVGRYWGDDEYEYMLNCILLTHSIKS